MYETLFARLNHAGVRYVVVGGVAVVLHGYARLTADVDLVIDLEPDNTRRAIEALQRDPANPLLTVDLFAREPIPFAELSRHLLRL